MYQRFTVKRSVQSNVEPGFSANATDSVGDLSEKVVSLVALAGKNQMDDFVHFLVDGKVEGIQSEVAAGNTVKKVSLDKLCFGVG